MTQTGGFPILTAWLIFAALLATFAFFVLRPTKRPEEEAGEKPDDPGAVP